MISRIAVEITKELLRDRFPGYAYWLFYSEIGASLVLILMWAVNFGVGLLQALFLWYASATYVASRNYGRKIALKQGLKWSPSKLDWLSAGVTNLGFFIGGSWMLLWLLRDAWADEKVLSLVAAGLCLSGVYGLVRLCRGRWLEWP